MRRVRPDHEGQVVYFFFYSYARGVRMLVVAPVVEVCGYLAQFPVIAVSAMDANVYRCEMLILVYLRK